MNPRRLLGRVSGGALGNVAFADFRGLVRAFGFRLVHVAGSHFIFTHPKTAGLLNIQEVGGEAKPCQIRQFLRLVERYNLRMEGDR